jgi:uncharacterized protein YodC (DUF2158 family)
MNEYLASRASQLVLPTRHPVCARAARAARACHTQNKNAGPAIPTGKTMTTRYEIGDVVRLKSGGQPMTVNQVGPVAFAPGVWLICQWFDQKGELRQEMFHEDMVLRLEEPVAA